MSLGIVSNKPQHFTVMMVERFLAAWQFGVVFGARPDVPKKPDPTMSLAAAQQLGYAPPECIYLGDTNTDMQTARAANMYGVGVLWGFREAHELRESGAQALIAQPQELLPLIV